MSRTFESAPVSFESLENRRMLSAAPRVSSFTADNRGQVVVTLSAAFVASSVNSNSVLMYTVGKDKKIGTKDDTQIHPKISIGSRSIVINGNTKANALYRIKLNGNKIVNAAGQHLDGEFKGTFPSGNGKSGGSFEAKSGIDTSGTPVVRMDTSQGVMYLDLFRSIKPISVANFLNYTNRAEYDNIMISRSEGGFIVQTGSLKVNGNTITKTPVLAPIKSEFNTKTKIHNIAGTIAFALGNTPDSATNQFFFNIADNSAKLDAQNGGFTVFAGIDDNASYAVLQKIAKFQTVTLHNPATGHGVLPNEAPTGVTDVPVVDPTKLTGVTESIGDGSSNPYHFIVTGGFNATRDLIIIRRTAQLMTVNKL